MGNVAPLTSLHAGDRVTFIGAEPNTPGAQHFHRIATAAGLVVIDSASRDALVVIPSQSTHTAPSYASRIKAAVKRGCEIALLADFKARLKAGPLEPERAKQAARRARVWPPHLAGNALVEDLPPANSPYTFKL